MRTKRLSTGIAIVLFATTAAAAAAAQDSAAKNPPPIYEPPVPARSILALRDDLQLSDAQLAKLKAFETTQIASLSRATAAFLRAEADLLDASRRDDVAAHRLALEKRAKIAIDAEVGRLQAEKDSRAVLTADQRAKLVTISDSLGLGGVMSEVAVWQSIVTPPPLTRVVHFAPPLDSVEVRIAVMPIYADIYLDGLKIGSGRRFVRLAIGAHTLLYHAAGCTDITVPITVEKGPPLVVPRQTLTCSFPVFP
jgi:Spy/CpxP family protein refolding chaperone